MRQELQLLIFVIALAVFGLVCLWVDRWEQSHEGMKQGDPPQPSPPPPPADDRQEVLFGEQHHKGAAMSRLH